MEYHIPRDMPEEEKLASLDRIAREKFSRSLVLREWQRQAAKDILTGKDVLLLAPTGGGKSLLFYLYALARPNEFVIVISPLKMLEKNMVQNLTKKGISAIALNADTVSQAHREGRDIWKECKRGDYRVVLCSPELLPEPSMNDLLTHDPFRRQVGLVVVDEAHLIPLWGGSTPGRQAFRRAFDAIGTLRSRLDSQHTVFLGLSATLMPGQPVKTVEKSLGFRKPDYEFVRLDCERKNIYIMIRRIREGSSDGTFRDLCWVLQELFDAEDNDPKSIPKTIIYVDNIAKGWQLVLYLRKLLPAALQQQGDEIIRHVHASTCATCKDEILTLFSALDSSILRIVVATEVFGCGIDIGDVMRVILFGTPRDLDSAYQRLGRLARLIVFGWGYIYVNAGLWDTTCARLGVVDPIPSKRVRIPRESADTSTKSSVCPHFLKVLEAHLHGQCISKVINDLYANPNTGPAASCQGCSGCLPDPLPEMLAKTNTRKKRTPQSLPWLKNSRTRGVGRIKKESTDSARQKLTEAITDLFLDIPEEQVSMFDDVDDFVPESKINELVKHLRDLDTSSTIQRALGDDWKFWNSHGEALVAEVLRIRHEMLTEHEAHRICSIQGDKSNEREESDQNELESEDEGLEEEACSEPDVQTDVTENPPPCCSRSPERLIIRLRPPRSLIPSTNEPDTVME